MIKIIIKITGLFINFTKPDRKLYILEQRFTICPPKHQKERHKEQHQSLCPSFDKGPIFLSSWSLSVIFFKIIICFH